MYYKMPHWLQIIFVKIKDRSFTYAYACQIDDSLPKHRRFEHCNQQTLKDLHRGGLVENMPLLGENSGVCEVCELRKQASCISFSKNIWRDTSKL